MTHTSSSLLRSRPSSEGERFAAASLVRRDWLVLALTLLIGLVHGLIYIFLLPPWQHYDEPSHFELVWLAARQNRPPAPEDSNPEMVRQVLASMIAHGFYREPLVPPDLNDPNTELNLGGYNQFDEPPLYYFLAALPLRVLPLADVASQLYAARFVSLALLLVSLLGAWGIVREAADLPLRWMLPIGLALLPGFVELMTAVNNDALAVAVFTLFLWAAIRMVQRGLHLPTLLLAVGLAGLSFFVKSTAMLALVLLPLAILLSLARGREWWWVWGALAAALVAVPLLLLTWDDAAGYYRSTGQPDPIRTEHPQAVAGNYVLQLDVPAQVSPEWSVPLFQPLDSETLDAMQGQAVTVGVWMWASRPVEVDTPALRFGGQSFYRRAALTEQPAFFAYQVFMPAVRPSHAWLSFRPTVRAGDAPVRVFYDGLVLVLGQRPVDTPPQFSDPGGRQGEWGGQAFLNLLRNPSVETAGPRLRSTVDDLGARFLADRTRPSLLLASLVDQPGSAWLYWTSIIRLGRTFWGQFGWGHVPLIAHRPYWALGLLTNAALIGALIGIWRRRQDLPGALLVFLLAALFSVWGAALVRSPIYLGQPHLYLPVARYAYPVVAVSLLVFGFGWTEWFRLVGDLIAGFTSQEKPALEIEGSESSASPEKVSASLPLSARLAFGAWVLFFIAMDVWSWISIHQFYSIE